MVHVGYFVVVHWERRCIHNAKGSPSKCTLTPIFVFICNRCFGVYMVSNPTYGIEGLIRSCKWRFFLDKMFTNDTTLFKKGTPNSLQFFFWVLQTLCDELRGKM